MPVYGIWDYDLRMNEERDGIPANAFFRMEAGKTFPLVEPVISIGRMLENDLVIDDPRVSRRHAQLRAVEGHFVLSDLGSTGGIFINGRRITETIIYPDDSISLAGFLLTFQQDDPLPRPDLADTIE
jgi:pSer/pThr/pTyr-binding forkhead associated (FHA) protein